MGKVVLISGSSSGIGLETAKLFASAGWTVIAGMRNAAGRTTPLHDDRRIIVTGLDVTDSRSVSDAVAEVVKNHGGIDVLVNNAGYALTGVFEYFDEATLRKQIDTNVIGMMTLTREVLPHMRERGGGTIVNIASIAGKTTFPFYSFYHATKWAVEGFSESLQHELVPFNIKVHRPASMPGWWSTPASCRSSTPASLTVRPASARSVPASPLRRWPASTRPLPRSARCSTGMGRRHERNGRHRTGWQRADQRCRT